MRIPPAFQHIDPARRIACVRHRFSEDDELDNPERQRLIVGMVSEGFCPVCRRALTRLTETGEAICWCCAWRWKTSQSGGPTTITASKTLGRSLHYQEPRGEYVTGRLDAGSF